MEEWQTIPKNKKVGEDWETVPKGNPPPSSESTITKGAPWWMRDVVKPTMEMGGLALGGASALPAGPMAPVAAVPLAGAGYALGKKGYEMLEMGLFGSKEPGQVSSSVLGTSKDILTGAAMEATGQIVGGLTPLIPKTSIKKIDQSINKGIEKGIRPSVSGKSTYQLSEKYSERTRDAVKTIISNKNNLQLTDEAGNIIQGKLPKNLKQFSQAIDQSKREVFKQYDVMAGKAGHTTIDLNPISQELKTISNNKVINDISPNIAKYAEERSTAFANRGTYSPMEAQDAIAHLNQGLEAFYKNPTYENASKASVDSMIANRLRRGLDETIENAVGPGYQQLKNTYGALSAIEKDVAQKAIVDARKNIKGLIDFSDIFSGSQVIYGILQTNPSIIGAGATAKMIASIYRHWNNPNRIIKNMFGSVETKLSQIGASKISQPTVRLIGKTGAYVGLMPQMQQ